MSETRLEKYKKYRQSLNEFKSINDGPESLRLRETSVISEKMNTTSTLPLEEVLGKIDDESQEITSRILTKKLAIIIVTSVVGFLLVAGIIIFAIFAFWR